MLPIRRSGRESEWGILRRFNFFLMIQQWKQIIDYKNGTQIFKTKTEKTQISSYL